MRRVFRIFLKPSAVTWADFDMAPGQTMDQLLGLWRTEGVLTNEAAGWVVPYDGWLFAAVVLMNPPVAGQPWRPTVVPFSGVSPDKPA